MKNVNQLKKENKELKMENRWLYGQLMRLGYELEKRRVKNDNQV